MRARLTHVQRGSKGTKFTYLFSMTNVARLQLSEYPNELVLRYDIRVRPRAAAAPPPHFSRVPQDQLGTGAFSEVRMAVERNTGNLRAVKILDKFKYTGGTAAGDSLAREVDILKVRCSPRVASLFTRSLVQRLSHPNIIAVHDVIDTERMLCVTKGGCCECCITVSSLLDAASSCWNSRVVAICSTTLRRSG